MFPVRCYTCNSVLADKHPEYNAMLRQDHMSPKSAMQKLAVHRMCCRRMFLGHTNIMQEQIRFGNCDTKIDANGIILNRQVNGDRVVVCD